MISVEQAIITADGSQPDKRLEEFGVDVNALIQQGAAATVDLLIENKGDMDRMLLDCVALFMAGASIGFELGREAGGSDQ